MARYPRRAALSSFVALVTVAAAMAPPGQAADDRPLTQVFAPPFPVVNATLNLTVVLAGLNLSPAEKGAIPQHVNRTWMPVISSLGVPLGVNYTVNLRIVEAPANFTAAYAEALQNSFGFFDLGRVVGNYIGLWQNLSAAFPAYTNMTPVRHADAEGAAYWLGRANLDFPEVAAPAGEARLYFLNPTQVQEPYYYAVNSSDPDRGTRFVYETLNAWGDGDGVFFQDLRANPSQLGTGSAQGTPADFAGQPPIWSYGTSPGERARLVADLGRYIDHSIRILIAPSFVVTPFYPISVSYNVTLFDATAAQSLFAPGGVGRSRGINGSTDLLQPSVVEGAVHNLIPFAPVVVRVHQANASTDPDASASLTQHTRTVGNAKVVDPFAVNEDLRARWNVPPLPIAAGDAVVIPVLIVVFDADAWVDSVNVRGATLQRSDGRAAAIVIAAGLSQLETRGFSEPLVHEAGHSLGLGHPHELESMAPNGTVVTEVDWLRSSSSTPMTYLPAYVDYSFDSFDRHALWYGIAAATLAGAFEVRRNAFDRLEGRGYNLSTLARPVLDNETLFETYAQTTRSLLAQGLLYLDAVPPYSSGGAIVMSKRAFDEAKLMLLLAYSQPFCCSGNGRPFLPALGAVDVAAAFGAALVGLAVWRRRLRLQ
jgi:hypothetical protein